MLLTLRIPVVDLRPFCFSDYPRSVRLPSTWSEDRDFVRYFGPVTKRWRGPIDPWVSERAYCKYDRALRFPPSYPALLTRDIPDLVFFGIKRRLYPATTRNDLFHVDLQLAGRSKSFSLKPGTSFRTYSPAKIDLAATINAVLSMPATVMAALDSPVTQQLGRLGPSIARALDVATTVGDPSGKLVSGSPAIAIEIEERDAIATMRGGEWNIREGLRLTTRTVVFNGRVINVFVVKRPHWVDRYRARALRIHLLRLHSEREYLRQLARLLAVDGFVDSCGHAQIERIQEALNQSLRTLTRSQSYGFSTSEIATAFGADRTISGAELEVLVQRVESFRPTISRRLRKLQELEDDVVGRWREFLNQNQKENNFIYIQEARVNQYDQRGSQIGAAGDNASASNFSFGGQLNLGSMSSTDAESLQAALRTLRKHLADQLLTDSEIDVDSQVISTTEIGTAIGALSEAEEAVAAKDSHRAQNALRRSGTWLASFAQGVGVQVAAAAIRAALHMP